MSTGKAKLLIAMPALEKSVFSHSVVLMAEQEKPGSLGFIINLPTGTRIEEALKLMKIDQPVFKDIPILFGGPVQTDFFWFIHSPEMTTKSTIKLHEQFYLSSALDIFPSLLQKNAPQIFFSGVGYAGWGEQQLEREIEEGVWWLGDFDLDLVFKTEHEKQWKEAIKSLGVDPEHLIDFTNPSDPMIN